jgi:hypothetical protein
MNSSSAAHPRANKVHATVSDRTVTFSTHQSLLYERDDSPLTVTPLAA